MDRECDVRRIRGSERQGMSSERGVVLGGLCARREHTCVGSYWEWRAVRRAPFMWSLQDNRWSAGDPARLPKPSLANWLVLSRLTRPGTGSASLLGERKSP